MLCVIIWCYFYFSVFYKSYLESFSYVLQKCDGGQNGVTNKKKNWKYWLFCHKSHYWWIGCNVDHLIFIVLWWKVWKVLNHGHCVNVMRRDGTKDLLPWVLAGWRHTYHLKSFTNHFNLHLPRTGCISKHAQRGSTLPAVAGPETLDGGRYGLIILRDNESETSTQ